MSSRRNLFLASLSTAVLVMVGTVVFGTSRAHAMILNPNPFPPGMPAANEWDLATCDSVVPVRSPGFTQWMAPAGSPTATSITVPYGYTGPIALEYDWSAAVCSTRNAVDLSNLKVSAASASTGSVSGIVGANLFLDFNPNVHTLGAYRHAVTTFNYTPPSALTSSIDVLITLDTKSVNRFTSGTIGCINPASPPPANFIDNCTPDRPSFLVHIDVSNPPPQRLITNAGGDCKNIQGWALDTSNVFSQLRVELRADIAFKPTPDAVMIANLATPVPPVPPALPGGRYGFSFDISSLVTSSSRNFYIVVRGVNAAGVPDGIDDFGSVITVPPCTPPTCTSLTTNPAGPEPGDSISATIGFNWGGPPSTYTITPPSMPPGLSYVGPAPSPKIGTTNKGQTMNYTVTAATAGVYSVPWRIKVGSYPSIICPGTITVAARPYVRVYGNDVAAGGKFADTSLTTCSAGPTSTTPAASIWAFTKTAGGIIPLAYGGASSQFAAFSLGQNEGFVTAGNHNGVTQANSPLPPTGLTFGNAIANAIVTTGYGGNSGIYRCIPDYYKAGHNPDGSNRTGFGIFGGNNSCIGSACGPLGLGLGGVVPKNAQAALFVDGNLKIASNIIYDGTAGSPDPTGWSSPSTIPAAYIVVRGDIYIDKGVTQLDGIYIAQKKPDGTGGHIYTCTNAQPVPASPSLIPVDQLYNQCSKKLTITGAFIALQVKFQRSKGTVGKSIASSPTNEDPSSDNIAEVFNFSQEMYLAPSPAVFNQSTGGLTGSGKYDSIISLPPIL